MPHPTTWTRVLGFGVTAAAIDAALQPLLVPVCAEIPSRASEQQAMDGKTMRGTIRAGTSSGVHLLSRYDLRHATVRHHVEVGSKANELTWAPHVSRASDVTGVLVNGDAMFAQRALSAQIVEAGGDYCWIVKGNQPTLYEDLRLLFAPQPAPLPGTSPLPDDFVTVRTVEKGHGRLDERILTVSSLLADYHPWPYLAQAFQVIRINHAGRRRRREVRYGITSVPAEVLDAAALLAVVRGHWQIENGLQYRRDVTLGEDASLVRRGHAPAVLAMLNTLVCTLVAHAGLPNLAAVQRAMAACVDRYLFRQ
jgi:predicted transposase YbfD/YdcC